MTPLVTLSLLVLASSAFADISFTRRTASTSSSLEAAVLPDAQFSAPIIAKTPRRQSKKSLITALRSKVGGTSFTGVVAGSDLDEEYLTNITVGGQHFAVIVDTGSSDTWLAPTGFSCFNLSDFPVPQSTCAFGPTYNPSASKTFSTYPNTNFNIEYGDEEFLTGSVGFDTVTVAGLTATHQEIGVATDAAWLGDGVSSGLLGLAFPDLTSVYNGSDPSQDSAANNIPYDPFFFTAVKQGKVAPFFSVALNRGSFAAESSSGYDPNLGYLSFGGQAPVPVTHTAATVPVQGYSITTGDPTNSSPTYFFYTVDVQSYTFPGSSKLVTSSNNTILDTGTTLVYVPTDVAKAYNDAFVPKAKFVEDEDTYYVDCNAKAPEFLVKIGGQTFSVDGRDQILPIGETDEHGREICISGTQDGGPATDGNIFILGDVFLHNVVATFNIQTNQVTLTQRQTY